MRTRREKVLITVLIFVIIFIAALSAFFVLNGPNCVRVFLSDYSKERYFKGLYESEGQKYYNYMPKDILEKHRETIMVVDEMIRKKNTDINTSDNKNFDLNAYLQTIRFSIITSIDKNDPLYKKVADLENDISNRVTIKK